MLKKLLIIGGIILLILVGFMFLAANYFGEKPETLLDFIVNNPDKAAIRLLWNEEELAAQNVDKVMPLASTVKILVAIEYAYQASSGEMDMDEMIPLADLDRYYVPKTDGGAHPAWLSYAKDDIVNEHIAVKHIVKGMLVFSSNANTEWIIDRLGPDRIDQRADSLGIKTHSDMQYIVSALFVSKHEEALQGTLSLEESIRNMTDVEYNDICAMTHTEMKKDPSFYKDASFLDLKLQRIWSDRLPSSTVKEYSNLMAILNSKTILPASVHEHLDPAIEGLMENPQNQQWLQHAGGKGGSTAFVLTKAAYATDKKENRMELAYFFDELSILQNTRLQSSMNSFELAILTDAGFRQKIMDSF